MANLGADFGPILRQLDVIAGTQVRRDLTALLAREALTQVRYGFEHSVAPDDTPWPASIRVETFGGKTLIDRRRLMGSFASNADERGFRIFQAMNLGEPSVQFAATHQYGATIRAKKAPYLRFKPAGRRGETWAMAKQVTIPQRKMLPDPTELPIRWELAFFRRSNEILERFVAGITA